ncbi:MAG: FAD:protein FMN transferase [Ruminococcaceae bacterium]|nr:FAD:protein FMN transferase [Oscillospiraceae bacterium]
MKKLISVILILVLSAVCCSCGIPLNNQRFSRSFYDYFDTVSTVTAYDTDEAQFNKHYDAFHNKLGEYHRLFDIYNEYEGINNIKTINDKAKDSPVKVDERIIELLEFGKEVFEISGGKTNICFGSVLSLWHTAQEEKKLPDENKLKEAAKHTDINDLVIDSENKTVFFKDKDLKLDVGAIAKGWVAKEICNWAQSELWNSAMLSLGGNICTFGYKESDGKSLWNVQIESPKQNDKNGVAVVKIKDMSVVTSGDYQRYFELDGKRYCHIINTDTLYPSEFMHSVSVLCKDSALADALSTTLFNMSIEEGKALIEKTDGTEAVWVDESYNTVYSSGFESFLI